MKRYLYIFGSIAVLSLVLASAALFGLYQWASADLPNIKRIDDYRPPMTTRVLARDGSLMGIFFNEKRTLVTLDEMSKHLPAAFLAAEDAQFYEHEGINPIAIFRAFLVNLQSGTTRQGGSTITQQVIKRLLLTPERSYERKLKEAILAYRLERYLTKKDILTIYMNQIFLGSNAYGVEQAARTYFNKHAKDLNIAESALIAGLPQAPSRYNPYRDFDAARNRQMYVLRRLQSLGWITDEEYEEAVNQPMEFESMTENAGSASAYYLEEIRRRLIVELSEPAMTARGITLPVYGETALYELGLTVKTAMVPSLQDAASKALRHGLEATSKRHGWQGALENIAEADFAQFLAGQSFNPEELEDGAWVKALVTKVSRTQVNFALGQYTGVMNVAQMSWARKPNIKVFGLYAPAIKNANNVLAVGDIVWVSYFSAPKAPPYDANTIISASPIPLMLQQWPEVQGALVSMEPDTGDVVAMSGGYAFTESHFNRVTQAYRQPGSAFKPFVYSAALDHGYTSASIVLDAPVVYFNDSTDEMWRPGNYEGNFRGPMLFRTALALSRNLCTIRIAQQIGISTIIERAQQVGLAGHFPPELAISLGSVSISPLNITQAYTAFANEGLVVTPRFVLEVVDFQGQTLLKYETEQVEAISPQNAYVMASLLKEVVRSGTGKKANIFKRPLAGKTGTTNEERDAWFIGFTPSLVTSVFVGYDIPKPMGRLEIGGITALPLFVEYAKTAMTEYSPADFTVPSGVSFVRVNEAGQLTAAVKGTRSYLLPFYMGTQPVIQADSATSGETVKSSEDLLKQLF